MAVRIAEKRTLWILSSSKKPSPKEIEEFAKYTNDQWCMSPSANVFVVSNPGHFASCSLSGCLKINISFPKFKQGQKSLQTEPLARNYDGNDNNGMLSRTELKSKAIWEFVSDLRSFLYTRVWMWCAKWLGDGEYCTHLRFIYNSRRRAWKYVFVFVCVGRGGGERMTRNFAHHLVWWDF